MFEWLRFVVSVAALPAIWVSEALHHGRYMAWEAAQRQRRIDEAEGE